MKLNMTSNTAAFFDMDGTLLKTNVVNHYVHWMRQQQTGLTLGWTLARIAAQIPYYLMVDRVNRDLFNEIFYRNYTHLSLEAGQAWSQGYFQTCLKPKLFPAALERIEWHHRQGDRIVLVTGSLDFIVAPLTEFLGATAITAKLQHQGDRFTGELAGLALAGDEKARQMHQWAEHEGIDLSRSYAYGDSSADLPMLHCVGHPAVVNPDRALREVAEHSRWVIHHWEASAAPHLSVPTATRPKQAVG